jgi:hypothetical protein
MSVRVLNRLRFHLVTDRLSLREFYILDLIFFVRVSYVCMDRVLVKFVISLQT